MTNDKSQKPRSRKKAKEADFITLPSFDVHPFKVELKKLGVRNWQIAKICGISYGYMSHILNGVVPMPDRVAEKISVFLTQRGVDIDA